MTSSWRGTSDDPHTAARWAGTSVSARVQWLQQVLELAASTGALQSERGRRQQAADEWAARWLTPADA